MKQIWVIARLTLKAAVASRFLVVFLVMLIGTVALLPLLIRHDGSAPMFTRVIITYTLSILTTLLIGATVWLSAGAISREVAECQMQILTTKPIPRWKIWCGKWMGITLLNTIFLMVLGAMIYGLVFWQSRGLEEDQRTLLRERLMVARGSLIEEHTDRDADVERVFQKRLNDERVKDVNPHLLRQTIEDQFKMADELVPGNSRRRWDLSVKGKEPYLKDKPLQVHVVMNAANVDHDNPAYRVLWVVGDVDTGKYWSKEIDMLNNNVRQFSIPANMWDTNGTLRIEAWNYSRDTLRFPVDQPLEVLFPEGSFEMNFVRGLLIIFFWLVGVAAIGLAASAYLSLPVASFVSLTAMVVILSGGLLNSIVEQRTIGGINHDTGERYTRHIDPIMLPLFKLLNYGVSAAKGSSPISRLSQGRSVSWESVASCFARQVLVGGGFLAGLGIFLFNRRELAALSGGGT